MNSRTHSKLTFPTLGIFTRTKKMNNTFTLNNVTFELSTVNKFFSDARIYEKQADKQADSASYNTIIACLASVIKESYKRGLFLKDKEIRKYLLERVYCIDTTDSQKSNVYRKAQAVIYLYKTAKETLTQVIESATEQTDADIITTAIKASERFTSQRNILKYLESKRTKKESAKKNPESDASDASESESSGDSDAEIVITKNEETTPEETSKALFMQAIMLLDKMDVNHRNTLLNEFSKVLLAKMESAQKSA